MKKRINIILAVFAVTLLMVFSINVFSQDQQAQPEESTDKATMMEECMSQMDSEMMSMCSKMMANMEEGSSMCNMMMEDNEDNTDKKEIEGDQPEKENPSDESQKQREVPEIKG